MKTNSGNTVVTLLALVLLGTTLTAQQTTAPAQTESNNATPLSASSPLSTPPSAASEARIVRLSSIQGTVQIDRNTDQGLEKTLLNLPITQGATLSTAQGFAEVEFEDDSTLRIIPSTTITFPQLELLGSGATASTVNLRQGTVYVSLESGKNKEFNLIFGAEKLTLMPSSHVRLHLGRTKAKLVVFNGSVQAEGPSGTMVVGKKKTLTFDLTGQKQPILAKHVAQSALDKIYDAWDQQAIDYHKKYARTAAYGSLPYTYGVTDLNYYGSFVNAPGCGPAWRPFLASAGWDPFMNGTWAWYPASGYSWVSSYPWGWMPFHSGDWEFCPAYGWGWHPGPSWVGLRNHPKPVKPPAGFPVPRPPRPPVSGSSQLVTVNRAPGAVSTLTPGKFVVRNDSAGLGVPRGFVGNMGKLSSLVQQHGSLNLAVTSTPGAAAGKGRAAGGASVSSARSASAPRTGSASYPHSTSMAAGHSSGGMRSAGASAGMGHMAGGGGSSSSGGGQRGPR
jgi:hypothetical protein